MNERLLTEKTTKRTLIGLFIIVGLTIMGLRVFYFDTDRIYPEDTAWKISLAGQFQVEKDVTLITSPKPKSGRHNRLISQRFYYPSLRLQSARTAGAGQVMARARRSGIAEFLLEYHVQLSPTPALKSSIKVALDVTDREKYLHSDSDSDAGSQALLTLSNYLRREASTKPELVSKIFSHSKKLVETTGKRFDVLNHVISTNKATNLGRARLMVALCRKNDIPARLVTGFILQEGSAVRPHYWVEVYMEDESWQPYDPEKGYEREIPARYVTFGYDNTELFSVENGKLLLSKFSIAEDIDVLNVSRFEQEKDFFDVLDLRRLNLETRQTFMTVLVLPFCILLTAFFRSVLGFYPYGTFTASLLALAMVHAEPFVTLVIATIVIFLALFGRSVLPKTCPRAPRLSLIFTFVALSMVFSISLLSYFSLDAGGNIILLPTVILVAVVDRFYSYMDKSGTHAAVLRLIVTVIIAVFCIPILQFEFLGNFIVAFPEAHLLTAALVLLLSGYKGKKLTDYKYLKLLGENKTKKSRNKTDVSDAF